MTDTDLLEYAQQWAEAIEKTPAIVQGLQLEAGLLALSNLYGHYDVTLQDIDGEWHVVTEAGDAWASWPCNYKGD